MCSSQGLCFNDDRNILKIKTDRMIIPLTGHPVTNLFCRKRKEITSQFWLILCVISVPETNKDILYFTKKLISLNAENLKTIAYL
jgi:hypothetical protein